MVLCTLNTSNTIPNQNTRVNSSFQQTRKKWDLESRGTFVNYTNLRNILVHSTHFYPLSCQKWVEVSKCYSSYTCTESRKVLLGSTNPILGSSTINITFWSRRAWVRHLWWRTKRSWPLFSPTFFLFFLFFPSSSTPSAFQPLRGYSGS